MLAGIAQLVERNLAKVEVAGSKPVSRSFTIFSSYFLNDLSCIIIINFNINGNFKY